MRIVPTWFDAPRRLMSSFVLLLLLPAVAVAWLGVQLLEQDSELAARQLRERRDMAADRVVAELERGVSTTERRLAMAPLDLGIVPDDDALVVTIGPEGLKAYPKEHLLYEPNPPERVPEPLAAFTAAEGLEFRSNTLDDAVRAYAALAQHSSEGVRAGALVRLARTHKKMGRTTEALRAYDALAQLPDAYVSGLPADLVARRARAALLEEIGRTEELRATALALRADLATRRWNVDRGTFGAYVQQVDRWLGSAARPISARETLTAAADWLWQEHQRESLAPAGRHSLRLHDQDLTLLWQSPGARLVALIAGPRYRQREWADLLTLRPEHRRLDVTLVTPNAQPAAAAGSPSGEAVLRRSAAETGLPWSVVVADRAGVAEPVGFASRRRTVLAGLALLFAVVVAGAYVMARSVARELAVARLQSDFVSAVSHEFRTPLTSLLQFTALLIEDDALPVAKRRMFYHAQSRAARRLTHLVESLLDFGRMEAGAHPYRLELLCADSLVSDVVSDFRGDGAAEGFAVEYSADVESVFVRADRDALTRAIRNVLENAVKYSGAGRRVMVHLGERAGLVAISVRDEGLGIPPGEQRDIFNKFVRGSASHVHGIKGTGIGLAMVRHIVHAHGGRVALDSEMGRGSTFTICIPAVLQPQAADSHIRHEAGSTL